MEKLIITLSIHIVSRPSEYKPPKAAMNHGILKFTPPAPHQLAALTVTQIRAPVTGLVI